VGKERGGGREVGAREGRQGDQGPRPCSREGARRGRPTYSPLYYDDPVYLMYLCYVILKWQFGLVETLLGASVKLPYLEPG